MSAKDVKFGDSARGHMLRWCKYTCRRGQSNT